MSREPEKHSPDRADPAPLAVAPNSLGASIEEAVPAGLLEAADLGLLRYALSTDEVYPSRWLARWLKLASGTAPCPLPSIMQHMVRRDRCRTWPLLRELPNREDPISFSASFRRPDGEIRHARITLVPQRSAEGSFVGTVGIVADETEAVRQSLNASDQFLTTEAYFRNSPTPTAVFERIHGTEYLIDVNPALERLTGGGIHAEIGQSAPEMTRSGSDEIRTGIVECVRDCLASGEAISRRFSFYDDVYKHEASVLDVTFTFAPPNRVIVQIHSLTEIVKALNASRKAERDFRTLAEHAPAGILRLDAGGHASYANPRILEMLHVESLQHANLSDPDAPAPPDLTRAVQHCLRTSEPITVRYPLGQPPDGVIWLESHLRPELNIDGECVGILGITTDITETVNAAKVMENRERQLRSVFDNIADPVVVADEQGFIRIVNNAFLALTGRDPSALIGKSLDLLMPEHVAGRHFDFIDAYRRTGEAKLVGQGPREVELVTGNGGRIPVELTVGESGLEPEVRYIASLRDLRERKASEERQRRLQKMEALGQLTGGVAHDFNNVLSILKGNVELIAHYAQPDAEVRELIENLELAIDQGSGLTSQLLAFSRRDAGPAERVNAGEVARGAVRLLRSNLGSDIELTLRADPNLWTTRANRNDLLNVVVNLVLNSRDALDGAGRITISLQNEPHEAALDEKCFVRLSVEDDGRGIDPTLLPHVCEPFFTSKASGGGTGLGLSLAQAFAEQSGGDLQITSEEGNGTIVSIRLPRDDSGDVWCDEEDSESNTVPRVVVVERDEALSSFIRATLGSHAPCVTSNARAALSELAGHEHVSALITNVLLPHGVKGVDVAQAARKLHPDIACVFISAIADGELTSEASRFGEVLPVPLSEAELLDGLKRARSKSG